MTQFSENIFDEDLDFSYDQNYRSSAHDLDQNESTEYPEDDYSTTPTTGPDLTDSIEGEDDDLEDDDDLDEDEVDDEDLEVEEIDGDEISTEDLEDTKDDDATTDDLMKETPENTDDDEDIEYEVDDDDVDEDDAEVGPGTTQTLH